MHATIKSALVCGVCCKKLCCAYPGVPQPSPDYHLWTVAASGASPDRVARALSFFFKLSTNARSALCCACSPAFLPVLSYLYRTSDFLTRRCISDSLRAVCDTDFLTALPDTRHIAAQI